MQRYFIYSKRGSISVYILTDSAHYIPIRMASSKTRSAHLALLFCNIIWACDYPFYSLVLGKYISPAAMVTASLIVAALWSLLPLLWEQPERIDPADRIKILGAALLIGLGRKLCMMYGMVQTSPIDGSLISTTTPLIVLLLSVAVGLERFTTRKSLGLVLGMAGTVAVILTSGSSGHEQASATGNLLIFTSACISAAYMVWFKQLVIKYRITTLLRWIYSLSALIMLPFGAHDLLTTDFHAMHTPILLAALFVLIVPTYLPNLLLNHSLKFVAPTVTSSYSYLQPVVAIGLSVLMGLDRLHADTILFALVIFCGVWLVISSYGAKKEAAQ